MMPKNLKNDWNRDMWVLIWEFSVTIPTWQGLNGFWKSLCPCDLDEGNLSIGRVNSLKTLSALMQYLMLWTLKCFVLQSSPDSTLTSTTPTSSKSPLQKKAYLKEKDKHCLVCGDKALGFNFNAITCESCKAFFRRNAGKVRIIFFVIKLSFIP